MNDDAEHDQDDAEPADGVARRVGEQKERAWEPWSFTVHPDEPWTLRQAVGQALGGASTCWVGGTGSQEFDSTRAGHIVDLLLKEIEDFTEVAVRRRAPESDDDRYTRRDLVQMLLAAGTPPGKIPGLAPQLETYIVGSDRERPAPRPGTVVDPQRGEDIDPDWVERLVEATRVDLGIVLTVLGAHLAMSSERDDMVAG